jgi:NAD(P)-dependent dehydrogenase (short-subunit alcohol dehydrogenase family)
MTYAPLTGLWEGWKYLRWGLKLRRTAKYQEIFMTELNGTVVVVTGAGGGIGREIALHQGGAKVAVLARTAREIDETASLITGAGGTAIAISVDLVDRLAVEDALARSRANLARLTLSTITAPSGPSVRDGNATRMSGGKMSRSISVAPSTSVAWSRRRCSIKARGASSTCSVAAPATASRMDRGGGGGRVYTKDKRN